MYLDGGTLLLVFRNNGIILVKMKMINTEVKKSHV